MPRKKKVEEEVFHVEAITKARVSEEGEWEYYVKWFGYDSDADSWEPSSNVEQCERLLTSFWEHVGMDDKDYDVGTVIAAQDEWIDREKKFFHDNFVKPPRRKVEKAAHKNGQDSRKSKSSTPLLSAGSANGSQSSDEEPLEKSPKRHPRKARIIDTDSESEVDHDEPHEKAKPISRQKAPTQPSKETPKVKRPELTLAASSSASIAPPRVTAVRTHQDQRTNPLVKPMSLPPSSIESVSSLSTKQRIAAGIPSLPTGPKQLPPPPKKAMLQSLSFKKNKPVITASTRTTKGPTTSSVATPMSPTIHNQNIVDDAAVAASPIVASPQPMDVDQPVDHWDSFTDYDIPMAGSSDFAGVLIPPKSQEEDNAEKFLQTVHLPGLNAPMEEDATPIQLIPDIYKSQAISKIPKKWKWSGDLFISTGGEKTELLCVVTIADPHGTSNTSHINLLLSPLDSLRISKLYPIMELSPLFRGCQPCQYFGTLESMGSNEGMLQGLEHYMNSEKLAAAIPLLLDSTEVAVLIVFPGAEQGLAKFLQVPDHLQSAPLIVGLLPFSVPTMTSTKIAGWRPIETVIQSSANQWDALIPHKLSQKAMLYQAISMLCFPKSLLDFLNTTPSRTYFIWPLPDEMLPGLDTIMLQYILESTTAVLVKPEEDVRVVFISNQYLKVLHTMPALVTKLVNSPEAQFWTYGYSANVISQSWQVKEVYPLGGVVTFTASALVEDLMGCVQLISKIIEHPFWDCYLIPEVLAVSHKLCSDEDPSSEIYLAPILDLINSGEISVMRTPGRSYSDDGTWLSRAFYQSNIEEHKMLEGYLEVLRDHPTTSSMASEQLVAFTNNEIAKDLTNAQIQQVFMESYRRFVVIRAASEGTIPFDQNGLEWSPLSLFSFKDDYFPL